MTAAAARCGLGLVREVRAFGNWDQHSFFAHDQRGGIVAGQLETVAVCDGVRRAGLDAKTAENTAVIVDIVDFGVTFSAADAELVGVFGGFDVDAVRRTCRRASTS